MAVDDQYGQESVDYAYTGVHRVPYRPSQYQMRLWQPAINIVNNIRQLLYHETSLCRLPNNILEVIEDIVRQDVCAQHGVPVEYSHSIFN